MSNKVTIEIDSIYYQLLKDYYDIAILHHQKKQELRESFHNNECGFSDLEIAERVYQGALDDFFRVLQKTSVMLVDSEPAPEVPAEPAPEESELYADNISSNDASNNDTSDESVVELPFPIVPHDDAPYTSGLSQRVITVLLSDEDCDKLYMKLGIRNATVGELVQNFIRDLVFSDDCNGSDECIFANQWFDRCWISHDYNLLMGFLNSNDIDPYDDLIRYMESIEQGESDLLEYEVNPGGFDLEEMEYLKEDMKDWKEHIGKIRRQFLATYPDANWTCEFESLESWYKEREDFKNIRVRYLNKNI